MQFFLYNVLFNFSMLGILDVMLNFYFVSLGHDAATIALLQSAPRIGGLIASVPIGLLTDRLGTRRVMIGSSFVIGVGLLLMVAWPSLIFLMIAQFFVGLSFGAQQIAYGPFMMGLVERHERIRFFARQNMVSTIAMTVGVLIGGVLPALIASSAVKLWPSLNIGAQSPAAYGVTVLIASLVIFASLIPLYFVQSGYPIARTHNDSAVRERIPWGKLAYWTLPYLPFGFSGGLTFPFFNLFFRERFSAGDELVGVVMAIGWLGMALVPMLNPRIERRFGRVNGLTLAMVIGAVAFVALALAPSLWFAVVVFTIGLSFRNIMNPLFPPMIMDALPESLQNHASSLMQVMWSVGWFMATAISGGIQQRYGYEATTIASAVTLIVTALSITLILRHRIPRTVPLAMTEAPATGD